MRQQVQAGRGIEDGSLMISEKQRIIILPWSHVKKVEIANRASEKVTKQENKK
jgi:hypothetical protein